AIALPLYGVRRQRRKQLDDNSRKCPRCLEKDTLKFDLEPDGTRDDRQPQARLAVCGACDYDIREDYIRENRVCFPTVGIIRSGKTNWLLMLYRQIKNTNVQVDSRITKIPSREDIRFDRMVEAVVYNRSRVAPTVFGLPYPLTFHVNDSDPLGANRTMV